MNTGCHGGIISLFELKLARNLHRIICLFHLNEINLKLVIFSIDGPSASDLKLTGPVGRKISANDFSVTKIVEFVPVPLGKLPDQIDRIIEFSQINCNWHLSS